MRSKLLILAASATAVLAAGSEANAQVSLTTDIVSGGTLVGPSAIEVQSGEDLVLALVLSGGANEALSAVTLGVDFTPSITSNYDGTGSSIVLSLDGGFSDIDLSNNFGVVGSLDSNGDGSLGSLTLNATENYTISFANTVLNDIGTQTIPGDISVTVVPEPASLALLGLGGLMLVRRRR